MRLSNLCLALRCFGLAVMAIALLCLSLVAPVCAGPIQPGFDSTTFLANDDGSYPANGSNSGTPPGTPTAVSLGFTANFFGNSNSSVYINNNGNVTFGTYLSTYTPFGLTSSLPGGITGIIAPFFGDVDTRGTNGTGAGNNLVTFGNGTITSGTDASDSAFGVNWPGVGYYNQNVDKLNNFQLLLVDRSDTGTGNFDMIFNYGQIQWETGDASGGSGGLGGESAHVGWSNGSGNAGTNYELPGSGVNGAFLDSNLVTGLIHTTNDGVDGQFLFLVRNGQVINPSAPEPASMLLFGSGLVGLGIYRRRRKAA